jgi:hypothetical protein
MYKNVRITMAWIVTGYQHSKRALQASSSANIFFFLVLGSSSVVVHMMTTEGLHDC